MSDTPKKPVTLSGSTKVAPKVTVASKVTKTVAVTETEAKPFVVPSLSEQLALQRKIRSNG